MTDRTPVGISDIRLYVPRPGLDLDILVEQRVRQNPRLERHLARACRTTGQKVIRFPEIWEDTATIAATAARRLVLRSPGLGLGGVRHLAVGTETGVDHSKPVSAYVQGMLQRSGIALPSAVSSFGVQHACAGGTMAMLGVAAMLAAAGRQGESGIVVCSDIARYETESTAEVTQGAGGAALLVQESPRLLEIDLATVGYHSNDVDDFFRPLDSTTARVNGSYSMRCYEDSLEAAYRDFCFRAGRRPDEVLHETDFFVLHTPFRNMPLVAMEKLYERVLGWDAERARAEIAGKGMAAGVDPLASIGNLYTASMPAALAFLLDDAYRAMGEAIVGKRLLLASYGSGSTMVVMEARVAAGAPAVLATWDVPEVLASARPASFEEYETWTAGPVQPELHARLAGNAVIPQDVFALRGVRRDGYREYEFTAVRGLEDGAEEREAPGDMHGSVAVSG